MQRVQKDSTNLRSTERFNQPAGSGRRAGGIRTWEESGEERSGGGAEQVVVGKKPEAILYASGLASGTGVGGSLSVPRRTREDSFFLVVLRSGAWFGGAERLMAYTIIIIG